MNRVVRKGVPGAFYIGRPSIYGNPFVIGRDGNREEVIAKFKAYWLSKVQNVEFSDRARWDLEGKDLACFCAPLPCHGDVIMDWLENGH